MNLLYTLFILDGKKVIKEELRAPQAGGGAAALTFLIM
jgi:hypothetical protein